MKINWNSLSFRFRSLTIITSLFLIVMFIFILRIIERKNQLVETQKQQVILLLMAEEMKETSTKLTNLCRSFVATGDDKYRTEYEQTVAWKNGNVPRPSSVHHLLSPGVIISQHDLLKSLAVLKLKLTYFQSHQTSLMQWLVWKVKQWTQLPEENMSKGLSRCFQKRA